MIESVPAVIPAAGRSIRMGRPKALLDAGGKTFLARIIAVLEDGGASPLLVVVRDIEGPVAEEARRLGVNVIRNPDPSRGPISSFQAGIRALPGEAPGVLLAPVDHPLFSPETVEALIGAFAETRPSLVVPAFDGWRGHPVLFSRALFEELLQEDLPEGARTVVRRHFSSRLQLPVEDAGILADIDTPEEYRRHFSRDPSHGS